MSVQYVRFPLALLRTSSSAGSFFNEALDFCAVNAGLAFKAKHDDGEWEAAINKLELTKNQKKAHCLEALVGKQIVGISGGEPTGQNQKREHDRIKFSCSGSPFVDIDSEKFRTATLTTRCEAGLGDAPEKRISWREFRIIVAVYSLQWHPRFNFSAAGWESIRNRSCGFHRKADYQAFQDSTETVWPDHCIPLTRYQVTSTLDRLEALGFFIRHRISNGDRGGMTAYSIKHDSREKLAADCEEWQAWNRGETARENRADDAVLHAKMVVERDSRIEKKNARAAQILETCKSPKNPASVEADNSLPHDEKQTVEPRKHSKPTSDLQGTLQHNEKCSSKKCSNEKYINDSSAPSSLSGERLLHEEDGNQTEQSEEGHLIEGRFLVSADASKILIQSPDSWQLFKRARRITAPDGSVRIEEAA